MNRLSIQGRLTIWFFLGSAAVVALFAGASWYAMKASMYHTIDRDLRYRMGSVVPFIQSRGLNTHQKFEYTFVASHDASVVGVFVQITDDASQVLYESDILRQHRVPVLPAGPRNSSFAIDTAGASGWPVRYACQRIIVEGVPLTVHVIEPLRDLMTSLHEYSLYLAALIPLALVLTTTIGYWLSRRALAPVEQIRRQAEAVDPADLAARLQVPPTNDELARLAGTLNAMLARIETSFRSIEQFTADASHELRTPLALITTAAEVSLRRERTREELAEVLTTVVRETKRMSLLIANLLDLARGDSSNHTPVFSDTCVSALLREICDQFAPTAAAKGLILTADLPADDIDIQADSADLRRFIVILIDNAIKYTESGSITVALKSIGPIVTIIVSDTGIGMDSEALEHAFDRFWRADKIRSRAEGGAGLGLSIAKQIVTQHGGQISVISEPGRGSTFTVSLPAHSH